MILYSQLETKPPMSSCMAYCLPASFGTLKIDPMVMRIDDQQSGSLPIREGHIKDQQPTRKKLESKQASSGGLGQTCPT
jgi:hypothetical protein